jgi:hypothetical protein
MAGALKISTLNDDTGVLATQNGMTGIAKAWVNFNGTGTVAIRSSFNVSSITDNGTGNYTVNFTTAMPNANYGVFFSAGDAGAVTFAGIIRTYSTSSIQVLAQGAGGSAFDYTTINVSVFSS